MLFYWGKIIFQHTLSPNTRFQTTPDIANMQVDSLCANKVSFKQSSPGCSVISQAEHHGKDSWVHTLDGIVEGIHIWGMIWFSGH